WSLLRPSISVIRSSLDVAPKPTFGMFISPPRERPPPPRCAKATAEINNPITNNRRIMSVPPPARHTAPHTPSATRSRHKHAAQQLERLRRFLLLVRLKAGVDPAECFDFKSGHLCAQHCVGVQDRFELRVGLLLEQCRGELAAAVGDLLRHGAGLGSRL